MKHLEFPWPEMDYNGIMTLLSDNRYPRDKLTDLMRRGDVIRVKKGIYVPGVQYLRGRTLSSEILANMMYGPSCVSLHWALSRHGLIPEGVRAVTCAATGKNKTFHTPLGDFYYYAYPADYYSIGIRRYPLDADRGYLMAGPEKALCDLLYREKTFRSPDELMEFLTKNLRLETGFLKICESSLLKKLSMASGKKNLAFLLSLTGAHDGDL